MKSYYQNDFTEDITEKTLYSNKELIERLENIFEELEKNNDCSSELSGGWQGGEYCDKLVSWREVINQVKVIIEKKVNK